MTTFSAWERQHVPRCTQSRTLSISRLLQTKCNSTPLTFFFPATPTTQPRHPTFRTARSSDRTRSSLLLFSSHPAPLSPAAPGSPNLTVPRRRCFNQVGGVTILLDCGWDIHFDTALLEPLREVVKRVDLVLISHPDLEHLGVSDRLDMEGQRGCFVVWLHRERGFLGLDRSDWSCQTRRK